MVTGSCFLEEWSPFGHLLLDWRAGATSLPPSFLPSAGLLKAPGGRLPRHALLSLLDVDRQLLSTRGPLSFQALGRPPSVCTNRVSGVVNLTFFLQAARGSLHLFLSFRLDLSRSLMAVSRSSSLSSELLLSSELSLSPTLLPSPAFP